MELQKHIIAIITLFVAIAALCLSIFTYRSTREKEQKEIEDRTKIVMCQVGQLLHSNSLSSDSSRNINYFETQLQILRNLDLKNLDADLLGYVVMVQGFYQSMDEILKNDSLERAEKQKVKDGLRDKFHKILARFDNLKNRLGIKYNIVFEC